MKAWGFFAAGLLLIAVAWVNVACVNVARADETVDYLKQIKPILQARCYACHGVLKQQSGLRLDTVALAIQGGDGGATIAPGNAAASSLIERVSAPEESTRMPPEGEPLKPEEIAALKSWIAQGAKGPADEQPERDPREHWSFRTPVRPAIPELTNKEWVKNPIDAFIAAGHQQHGLTAQPTADKRIWLRRVSLDLVGLPPTRAELDDFVADQSSDACDKVVTRLLDSPQYGERWGRHWMDIWRYSDWWGLGAEVRNSQKHIWHWRDWIIESLNADKGYDQMLREMLAADELYPKDLDRLRASGFLARQYFKFNRTTWLDETVEHTSKAMLGLTFNCAKCHDHKYDPFSQLEYYRIRAVFEPYQVRTDLLPGETDFEKDGIPRGFDCNLDAQTFLHIRGDDRNPDKGRVIEPAVPAFLSLGQLKIDPVSLPAEAYQPGLRPFVVEAYLKTAERQIAEAKTALEAARKKLVESAEAAALAAAKPDDKGEAALPLVRDDFSAAKPELWELRGGMWSYADGKLRQSATGDVRASLRLKELPPADFEAKLKYTPTGGAMWVSVGICFDVAEPNNEILAYLSSAAGGPKSQVAYKQGAAYVYPQDGIQTRPVELNQPHELILRVRGTLINVIVDGKPSIAYRMPLARQPGHLELITYDAKAELLAFELNTLPESVVLTEPRSAPSAKPGDPPLPLDQAQLSLTIAQKVLATAELQAASIQARSIADRARQQEPASERLMALNTEAARTEKLIAVAKADEAIFRAELAVLRAAPEKREAAEKELTTSKMALETARKALETPGEVYTPLMGSLKMFESSTETDEARRKPYPTTSSGRRTAFAKWLTDPRHPLPARVAVNHLWARHFGRGLVPTVFDFGRKGTAPTHPELLDWLAVEFVEHGWSMKHIHRLIVTSNTYRLTSSNAGAGAATLAADSDNRFYWRANPVRMQAQLVRDSLLHLAGELDLTLGGPSIPIAADSLRRSVYFVHSHNEHQTFLSIFDDASVLECYRRAESIVPQQALALENSPLATQMAEKISQRIAAANPGSSAGDFIRAAFLTVLAMEPTESERGIVTEALGRLTEAAKFNNRPNPELYARTNLIQALLNHNDFITVR